MLTSMLSRLRPTATAIHRLAAREADPRYASDFAPVARGPVYAVLALGAITLLAAVWAPFRLLRRGR